MNQNHNIGDVLSSSAKWKVLNVLVKQTTPLAMRHVAYLADIPIRSVQLALVDLQRLRIVKSIRSINCRLFALNHRLPISEKINKLFSFLDLQQLHERAASYQSRLVAALEFADQFHRLVKEIKVNN